MTKNREYCEFCSFRKAIKKNRSFCKFPCRVQSCRHKRITLNNWESLKLAELHFFKVFSVVRKLGYVVPDVGVFLDICTGFSLGALITHYYCKVSLSSVAEVPLTDSANYL